MWRKARWNMSDFTPITTQDEFDVAIKDRISRAENAIEQKYSDYEEVKKLNTEQLETIATQKEQIETLTSTNAQNDKTITELNDKIAGYEKTNLKIKVANEAGLPFELAGKLSGDDEAALKKDATLMKSFMSKAPAQPLRNTESGEGIAGSKAALKAMLGDLRKE